MARQSNAEEIRKQHEDCVVQLGNLGARSWRSRQIWERGTDIATAFGLVGLTGIERAIISATSSLLAWSIRRDRKHWRG